MIIILFIFYMNEFEQMSGPEKESPEDESIRRIFKSRDNFRKEVKKTLDWSNKGGPAQGTPYFIRAVVGNIKLSPNEFSIISGAVKKEISKIEKEAKSKGGTKKKKDDPYKKMVGGAKIQEWNELRRSGGVDPNEI